MRLARCDDWVVVGYDSGECRWELYLVGEDKDEGHRWKSLRSWSLGSILFTAEGDPMFSLPSEMPSAAAESLVNVMREWAGT